MKVLKLKSDNFEGLITHDAYEELRLTMSTGDFHTHTVKEVNVKDFSGVTTITDILEMSEGYIGHFENLIDLGYHLYTENAANWDYIDVNQPFDVLSVVIDFKGYACDQIKANNVVNYKGHWFHN